MLTKLISADAWQAAATMRSASAYILWQVVNVRMDSDKFSANLLAIDLLDAAAKEAVELALRLQSYRSL